MSFDFSMMNRHEEVVGLDIGGNAVSAAMLKVGPDGALKVTHAGRVAYAAGADDHEIARALGELWRLAQLPTTAVCSCLRSPSLLVRSFRYPFLTDPELKSALRLVAEEELQMPGDQIQMDWHVFAPAKAPDSTQGPPRTEGFFIAVPRTETQRHQALLDAADLSAVVLDIGSTAIANLHLALRPEAQRHESVCLVHVSGHSADLAIIYDETRLYPRALHSPTQTWESAWGRLTEDVRSELRHFQFKLHHPPVQRILLTGDLATPAELAGKLEDGLALPVQHWEPLIDPRVNVSRVPRGEANGLPATVLGLAQRKA